MPDEDLYLDNLFHLTEETRLQKHSALTAIASPLTAKQLKCYNVFLYVAKKILDNVDAQKETFKVKVKTLEEFTGIEVGKNYQHLQTALTEIGKVQVETNVLKKVTNDEVDWGYMNLLAEVNMTGGTITFALPPTIRKALQNPKVYANISLYSSKKIQSKASQVLYENLVDNVYLGEKLITVENLRKLLVDGKYPEFKIFKRDVLDPSLEEINAVTDLQVTIRLIRKERKVVAVHFSITQSVDADAMREQHDRILTVRALFDEYGMKYKDTDVMQFINYDIELLKKGCEITKSKSPRSEMAYLHKYLKKMMSDGYFSTDDFELMKEKEAKEIKAAQKKILDDAGISFNFKSID